MILPLARFENLNPDTWKHLGDLLRCFFSQASILWVLTETGKVVQSTLDNEIITIDEGASASDIFSAFPTAGYIIRAEKSHLLAYYRDVNAKIESPIDIDTFYTYLVDHLNEDSQITYEKRDESMPPPPMWINIYGVLDRLIHENLPARCCLNLEIFEGEKLWFSLSAEIIDYKITKVSTLEGLPAKLNQPVITKQFHKSHVLKTLSMLAHGERKGHCV